MTLNGGDAYIAAAKQEIEWFKSGSRTTVAAVPFSLFDIAGAPGAGTLALANTANGIVPDDSLAGYPMLRTINGDGRLTRIEWGWTVAGRLALFDRLFGAGAYGFNADVTLASQPGFSARVPDSDYRNLQLWIEAVTAFTGSPSFEVNYLDQDGVAGDTGVVASGAALTVGRLFRMPLAAGDSGIQRVDRVRCTVATAGTFNVWIMRKLWRKRVKVANDGDTDDLFRTGAPKMYDTMALFPFVQPDSTASGVPELTVEIADA
jgi:hypothetical protein